jgi:CBS domain-containing protein
MKAADIMTKDVITVTPDNTVKEVAKILTDKRVSGAPVVEDGELVGVISEGDIIVQDKKLHFPDYIYFLDSIFYLDSLKEFEQDLKKRVAVEVKDLMTKDVITVAPEAEVEDVATILTEEDINRVPVVDEDNKLVGIITRADIVRYISQ